MNIKLSFAITHRIPQLDTLGVRLMDALQGIKDQIAANGQLIADEIQQAATLLQGDVTEAEKQEVVTMLLAQADAIRSIVPETPPVDPEPAPGA